MMRIVTTAPVILLVLVGCATSMPRRASLSAQSPTIQGSRLTDPSSAECPDGVCPTPGNRAPSVGVASHLQVRDLSGGVVDLSASKRLLALVFWQTWCKSCKQEAPTLARAARNYGDKIQFVGVVPGPDDLVDDQKVKAFVQRYGLSYPQVRDRNLELTRTFDIKGTPTIIVLGPNRKVIYRGHRMPNWGHLMGSNR